MELIREGAPEGQILSSLTRYFALCGNQSPEAFCVPLEHLEFVRQREALRATRDDDRKTLFDELRRDSIDRLARDMTRLVASLHSLRHEVTATPTHAGHNDAIHLRLVLQPLELAALPIELADAPNGLPGAGQPLCLQSQRPVIITRETHRLPPRRVRWPSEPKVLFAWAAPAASGLPAVPWQAHLMALTRALAPWLPSARGAERWLRLLPDATLEGVRELCAREQFTHVHLLLHGVEFDGSSRLERHLALAFDDGTGNVTPVDGPRLAAALAPGGSTSPRPTAVTIAACDAGQVGSILGGGASLAHHLHAEGVPLVVASQLPLSFRASVVLTEVLYDALLQGDDPRDALHALRRRLKVEGEHPWEWASVVAYAALPSNLSTQLRRVRFERASTAIDLRLDRLTGELQGAASPDEEACAQDRSVIDQQVLRLEPFTREGTAKERAKAHDYLGSVALRWIDVKVEEALSLRAARPAAAPHGSERASLTSLGVEAAAMRANVHYNALRALQPEAFWAVNVANELAWLQGQAYDAETHAIVRWHAAEARRSSDAKTRALGAITELSLLLMEALAPAGLARGEESLQRVYEGIVRAAGPSSYDAFRAQRVVRRFERWSTWRHAVYPSPVTANALEAMGVGPFDAPPAPAKSPLASAATRLLDWSGNVQVPARWPHGTRTRPR